MSRYLVVPISLRLAKSFDPEEQQCSISFWVFIRGIMQSFDFDTLPASQFPAGTYLCVLREDCRVANIVLGQVRMVSGWPNPVLEAARSEDDCPTLWLETIDRIVAMAFRPQFNMGIYCRNGTNYPVAIYGPIDDIDLPRNAQFSKMMTDSVPDGWITKLQSNVEW